jgi:2'-5' RNA ligase
MRLFTAVELPAAVREAVRGAFETSVLPQLSDPRRIRAVAAENLHVTVRFLGDVREAALPALREALAAAATAVPASAADLRARGFGAFPSARAPRVLWAGIDDPAATIAALEREVTARLLPLGFPREERPYTPHVTVARVQDDRRRGRGRRGGASSPSPLVLPADPVLGPAFAVLDLSLVESELTPQGSRYRTLARFPLCTSPSRNPQE